MKESKRRLGYGTKLARGLKNTSEKVRSGVKNKVKEGQERRREEQEMKLRAQKKGRNEALKIRERELERESREKALQRMRPGASPAGLFLRTEPAAQPTTRRVKKSGKKGKKKGQQTRSTRPAQPQQKTPQKTADTLKNLYDNMI